MAMPDDELAMRDRALLLLGYAGAFRRSELVALDVERLRFSRTGCYAWISSAKNDPRKRGASSSSKGCQRRQSNRSFAPSRRSSAGLAIVGPTGPVFRTFDLSRRHTTTRLDSGDVPRVLRRRSLAAGRLWRLRWSLVTPRLHYRRGKEEGAHRKHQAGTWAAI